MSAAFRVLGLHFGFAVAQSDTLACIFDLLLQPIATQYILNERSQREIYISGVLCRCLKVGQVQLLGELGGLGLIYHDVVDHVNFVSDYDYLSIGAAMLSHALDPVLDVLVTLGISHIVNKSNAHRTLVVLKCGLSKSLLSRCVPNLHRHCLIL